MTGHRTRSRIRREQLLDGASEATTGTDRLGELIAAASAPGRDDELGGLGAAAAAFHWAAPVTAAVPVAVPGASDAGSPTAGAMAPRRRALPRPASLATKIIAGAASAVAVGGIALAASTGQLPGVRPRTVAAGAASTTTGSATGSAHPDRRLDPTYSPGAAPADATARSAAGTASAASGTGGASPTPPTAASQTLAGLCRAWLVYEHDPSQHHDHQVRALARLVSAAGARSAVDDFCRTLLGPVTRASHSVLPTSPTSPSGSASPSPSSSPSSSPTTPPPTVPSHPIRPTRSGHPSPSSAPTHPVHPIRPSASPNPSPTSG